MQKFLIVNNFHCANRGDAAILQGLVSLLRSVSNIDIQIFTGNIEAARLVASCEATSDAILEMTASPVRDLYFTLLARVPKLLYLAKASTRAAQLTNLISGADGLIAVGGSYFIDEYGSSRYYLLSLATACRVPFVLCGHSLGPFRAKSLRKIATATLSQAKLIVLRDATSLLHANALGLPPANLLVAADTAWLVPNVEIAADELGSYVIEDRPTIAVTARNLGVFARSLGISQVDYEISMAHALDALAERGYRLIGIPQCTNLGGYSHDDRRTLQRIKERLREPEQLEVLMDDYNISQLCGVLSTCAATLATRMHSSILSMKSGTPAIGIPYEHKLTGLFEKMGFADQLIPIRAISAAGVVDAVESLVENADANRAATQEAAKRETLLAEQGVTACLNALSQSYS